MRAGNENITPVNWPSPRSAGAASAAAASAGGVPMGGALPVHQPVSTERIGLMVPLPAVFRQTPGQMNLLLPQNATVSVVMHLHRPTIECLLMPPKAGNRGTVRILPIGDGIVLKGVETAEELDLEQLTQVLYREGHIAVPQSDCESCGPVANAFRQQILTRLIENKRYRDPSFGADGVIYPDEMPEVNDYVDHVMVMPLVHGTTLEEVLTTPAKSALFFEQLLDYAGELGRIALMDILCKNADRVVNAYSENGEAKFHSGTGLNNGNLLIYSHEGLLGGLICIDNAGGVSNPLESTELEVRSFKSFLAQERVIAERVWDALIPYASEDPSPTEVSGCTKSDFVESFTKGFRRQQTVLARVDAQVMDQVHCGTAFGRKFRTVLHEKLRVLRGENDV
ncbi:MAG: hypothetical protein AB7F28_08400 [Candidatus Margulisiibacteriota bacterium]